MLSEQLTELFSVNTPLEARQRTVGNLVLTFGPVRHFGLDLQIGSTIVHVHLHGRLQRCKWRDRMNHAQRVAQHPCPIAYLRDSMRMHPGRDQPSRLRNYRQAPDILRTHNLGKQRSSRRSHALRVYRHMKGKLHARRHNHRALENRVEQPVRFR